jgi:hypothetical protein
MRPTFGEISTSVANKAFACRPMLPAYFTRHQTTSPARMVHLYPFIGGFEDKIACA